MKNMQVTAEALFLSMTLTSGCQNTGAETWGEVGIYAGMLSKQSGIESVDAPCGCVQQNLPDQLCLAEPGRWIPGAAASWRRGKRLGLLWRYRKRLVLNLMICLLGVLCMAAGGREEAWASEVLTVTSEIIWKDGKTVDGQEVLQPEKSCQDEAGLWYRLESCEEVPAVITGRSKKVSKEVVYEKMEAGASVPDRLSVEVEDRLTGKTHRRELPLNQFQFENSRWIDEFQFDLTFHMYGADAYVLGDYLVPYDEHKPALSGCEPELLKMIGVPEEQYQIDDIQWSGEAYTDGEGVPCRNAIATGKKKVRDCVAAYAGDVPLPDLEGSRYVAVYVLQSQIQKESPMQDREVGEAGGRLREAGQGRSLWRELIRYVEVSVALGFLLLSIVGLRLLRLLREKKKKES